MIVTLCSKKTPYHEVNLPYQAASEGKMERNMESFASCEKLSLQQLNYIGLYMRDFKAILSRFDPTAKKQPLRAVGAAAVVEEDSEEDD